MSLEFYSNKFKTLNMNRSQGRVSPHKVCMLSAVMDLIAKDVISNNRIFFNEALRQRFSHHFDQYRTEIDRDNPHLPFFHLRSEGFWHHQPKPGFAIKYQSLNTVGGPGAIHEHIAYAYLDEALFLLLKNQFALKHLQASLLENLNYESHRALLSQNDSWDWLECEAVVADYFTMLELELIGKSYNKTQFRRSLLPKLINRSDGAIEFKHQNISAVLIELGYPYISGYKPAFNYQHQLKEVVEMRLTNDQRKIEIQVDSFTEKEPASIQDFVWNEVLEDAPVMSPLPDRNQLKEPSPRYFNFAEREVTNRRLGEKGEEFVLSYERQRLNRCGRDDLAQEIEWTSKERGDGAGYDIRSFDTENEQELYIEVKTSNGGKYQPFYISENEVAFSQFNQEQYSLYRVFDYKTQPRLFILPGNIRQNVHLVANQYKARF